MAIRLLIAAACVAAFALSYSAARPSADGAAKAESPRIEVVEGAAYEPPELGRAASLPAIARRPPPPRPAQVDTDPAPVPPSVEAVEPESQPSPVAPAPEPVVPAPVAPAPQYTPPPTPTPPAPEPEVLTFDDSG
jgi:hypothetical protein